MYGHRIDVGMELATTSMDLQKKEAQLQTFRRNLVRRTRNRKSKTLPLFARARVIRNWIDLFDYFDVPLLALSKYLFYMSI